MAVIGAMLQFMTSSFGLAADLKADQYPYMPLIGAWLTSRYVSKIVEIDIPRQRAPFDRSLVANRQVPIPL